MPHLDPTFGIEIECYLPVGSTQQEVAQAISQRLGVTGGCQIDRRNGRCPHWKIVPDGSLQDYTRGIEIVSPSTPDKLLRGNDGLRQVELVCKALSDFGCTVSRACGFHVHVDAQNQPVSFFKNLVNLYSVYEPVIDSIMPRSRRASNGNYCRSMTSANPTRVNAATNLEAVIFAATNQRPSYQRRFVKLNLDAFAKHRTVEFRQHSGTLDATKATRWTVLCLRMVEAAKGQLNIGAAPAVNQARPGSKAHRIGEMLLRPQGVTGREICAEMNWPSVSINAQARAAGLTVTSQRTGREVRYFAVVAQATTAAPITLDGFAQVIGATDDERAYLNQRAADLSGSVQWAA